MAYLDTKLEIVEMDFPLKVVWETIKKALYSLDWTVEKVNESTFCMQAKTREMCFLSYATMLSIEGKIVSDNVSRVTICAETPVTAFTSVNFAKTQAYLNSFLQALSLELSLQANEPIVKSGIKKKEENSV